MGKEYLINGALSGKVNVPSKFLMYEGVETDTAKITVDNKNRKISADVKVEEVVKDCATKEDIAELHTYVDDSVQDVSDTLSAEINAEASRALEAESVLGSRISSAEALVASKADISYVDSADSELQTQIDKIILSSDVTDIVGTYQELLDYDTSTLAPNAIIKVLADSTHGGAMTYYRWISDESGNTWEYIGLEGPFYTKQEIDESCVKLTGNQDIEGLKYFADTIHVGEDITIGDYDDGDVFSTWTPGLHTDSIHAYFADRINFYDAVDLNGRSLTNIAYPTSNSDAATMEYVDNAVKESKEIDYFEKIVGGEHVDEQVGYIPCYCYEGSMVVGGDVPSTVILDWNTSNSGDRTYIKTIYVRYSSIDEVESGITESGEEDLEYFYSFLDGDTYFSYNKQEAILNGKKWKLETDNDSIYLARTSTNGQQVGSGSQKFKTLTLTSSDFAGYLVKEVIVTFAGMSGSNLNFGVTAGNDTWLYHEGEEDESTRFYLSGTSTAEASFTYGEGSVPGTGHVVEFRDVFLYKNRIGSIQTLEPEENLIYLNNQNNILYRYNGSTLVVVSETLKLGTTSTTAYRGDHGQSNHEDIQRILNGTATFSGNKTFSGNVTLNGALNTITNLVYPTNSNDAATKQYTDDRVVANPAIPSGETPIDLSAIKIGSLYYNIAGGGASAQDLTENTAATLDSTSWTGLKSNHSVVISNPVMTGLDSSYDFVDIKFLINNLYQIVKLTKNTTNRYSGLFFIEESEHLYELTTYYNGSTITIRCATVY